MNAAPMNKRTVSKPLASIFLLAISVGALGIPVTVDAKAKHSEKPLVSKKALKAKAHPASKKAAARKPEKHPKKTLAHPPAHKDKKLAHKDKEKHHPVSKKDHKDKQHPAKHAQAHKPKMAVVARHHGHKYAEIASSDPQQEYLIPGKPPAYLAPDTPAVEDDADAGPRPTGHAQVGSASYYNDAFNGGRTASGERFNQDKLTCAHGSLPFGCKLRVTNLRNHRSVDVKVNDRGGFSKYGRLVDLSKAAAREIGMLGAGTAKVKVEVLK